MDTGGYSRLIRPSGFFTLHFWGLADMTDEQVHLELYHNGGIVKGDGCWVQTGAAGRTKEQGARTLLGL